MSTASPSLLIDPLPAAESVVPAGAAPSARAVGRAVPSFWIDLAKALASQLILWHHFALYGPLCDVADALAPALFDALATHGRLVVQVFLVVGGFLAASSLWPDPSRAPAMSWGALPGLAAKRYRRLALPFVVALALVVLAAALARALIAHDSVPAAPTWGQLLAHALLLHDVLGVDALSAGVWYVAIDFQLYLGFMGLAAACRSAAARCPARWTTWWAVGCVTCVAVLSLVWWNRRSDWDMWAIYFAGAHGLGVLARWARPLVRGRAVAVCGLALLVAVALTVEWRSRIALAGAAALALCLVREPTVPWRGRIAQHLRSAVAWLSRISYPVFLLHYPVLLAVAAVVAWLWPMQPAAHAFGLVVAWGASLAGGAALQRALDRPAPRQGAMVR